MHPGSQGHPGWVHNHPTSLKFLSANAVCRNLETLCYEVKRSNSLDASASPNSSTLPPDCGASPLIAEEDDKMDIDYNELLTAQLSLVQYSSNSEINTKGVQLNINPNIYLPESIAHYILNMAVTNQYLMVDAKFLSLFRNTSQCTLSQVNLRGTDIRTSSLKHIITNHKITHLDIRDCMNLSSHSWEKIDTHGRNLVYLAASKNTLPDKRDRWGINLPCLRELVLANIDAHGSYWTTLLKNMKFITHLNLSDCQKLDELGSINHLPLHSLFLYNCTYTEEAIHTICKLTKLRALDISHNKNRQYFYEDPDSMLTAIIESLPLLEYLDISGTNLSGPCRPATITTPDGVKECDIPALVTRVNHPLDVLGLCHTPHEACKYENVPAKKILGDASEEQILQTVETLMPHKEQLTTALNELFHQFRYQSMENVHRALTLIFDAMTLYHFDEKVQISGSASLFYIMRSEANSENQTISAAARQQMISLIINAMERFPENILVRNGCLTISQLRVPEQVMFEYKRLVAVLLQLIRQRQTAIDHQHQVSDFVCRISIYLLNSLACKVEGVHKIIVGGLGAVEAMLSLICDKLVNKVHDDILEIAWSVMWNVTDETPVNCQRFLDGKGMEYFSRCLQEFPEHDDLLRSMMGLLGNVAEVPHLRKRLLTSPFIAIFTNLLKSNSGGIEVSYNAAGVLSHIASDGPEAWNIDEPTRKYVLDAMNTAINGWDLTVRRNINYRSFEPILRLLAVSHTPTCQYWSSWALCNLTRVYPNKYCDLIMEEGGIEVLQSVIQTKDIPAHISKLALTVVTHCEVYKTQRSLDGLYPAPANEEMV